MKVFVDIRMPIGNARKCEAAVRAVEPDNSAAPQGISVEVACINDKLVARVRCLDEISLLTCRNTVDDLLQHLLIALRTVRIINHAFKSSHVA